jgi:hypothetical protein
VRMPVSGRTRPRATRRRHERRADGAIARGPACPVRVMSPNGRHGVPGPLRLLGLLDVQRVLLSVLWQAESRPDDGGRRLRPRLGERSPEVRVEPDGKSFRAWAAPFTRGTDAHRSRPALVREDELHARPDAERGLRPARPPQRRSCRRNGVPRRVPASVRADAAIVGAAPARSPLPAPPLKGPWPCAYTPAPTRRPGELPA